MNLATHFNVVNAIVCFEDMKDSELLQVIFTDWFKIEIFYTVQFWSEILNNGKLCYFFCDVSDNQVYSIYMVHCERLDELLRVGCSFQRVIRLRDISAFEFSLNVFTEFSEFKILF